MRRVAEDHLGPADECDFIYETITQGPKLGNGAVPFFKHNNKLIYFSHVPKCGGTSIEDGLSNCGITLSFLDRRYWFHGPGKWNNSSPQHILNRDIARLIDLRIFDFRFACVRDPVARFLSAYSYNREIGLIPRFVSVEAFLSRIEKRKDFFSYQFDNHFVPASDIVPDGCKIFRLESGLDGIAHWLREVTADDHLNITFEHRNKRDWNPPSNTRNPIKRVIKERLLPKTPELSSLNPDLRMRIEKLYIKDYERFFG